MEALEFLKERSRMCKSYTGCGGCPLERGNCGLSTSMEKLKAYGVKCYRWDPDTGLTEI